MQLLPLQIHLHISRPEGASCYAGGIQAQFTLGIENPLPVGQVARNGVVVVVLVEDEVDVRVGLSVAGDVRNHERRRNVVRIVNVKVLIRMQQQRQLHKAHLCILLMRVPLLRSTLYLHTAMLLDIEQTIRVVNAGHTPSLDVILVLQVFAGNNDVRHTDPIFSHYRSHPFSTSTDACRFQHRIGNE